MTRFHLRIPVTITALALAIGIAQLAGAAQRGGRSFGQQYGSVWTAQLVLLSQVQSELKLSDEQKAKAAAVSEKLRGDRRALFQKISKESGQRQPELQKLNKQATASVEAMLDDAQRKRLKEIFLQVNGPGVLSDAEVAAALKISDDQKLKLDKVRAANAEALKNALQNLGDAPTDKRREATAKARRDGGEKLLAVLTADQRRLFAKMQGQKIDLDLAGMYR